MLRNDFGRAQSQPKEDHDLAIADPQLHFNNGSWIFPTTEGHFREGVKALKQYLARIEDPSRNKARFYMTRRR